jgi:RPA family protein
MDKIWKAEEEAYKQKRIDAYNTTKSKLETMEAAFKEYEKEEKKLKAKQE